MIELGRYQLLERIGAGGMAEVWRAQHVGPAAFMRTVAVKRMLPHLRQSPDTLRLFEREAVHMSPLHHANIVNVIDLVRVDDEYLIVMEYVDGVDLGRLLAARSRLPIGFTVDVLTQVCRGIEHAHQQQLVHRDLSPSNVLVARDSAVKITDFGVAKLLADARAQTQSAVRGKLQYMSPEHATGGRIDARSDLFSVGVVLYEMLTGARPFGADGTSLALLAGAAIAPPSSVAAEVPAVFDAICARALAADPAARYASAAELAAALAPLAEAYPWRRGDSTRLVEELAPRARAAPDPSTVSATAPARVGRGFVIAGLAAVALAAALGIGLRLHRRHAAATPAPAHVPAPPVAAPTPAAAAPTPHAAAPTPPDATPVAAPPDAAHHRRKRPAPGDPRFPELRDPFAPSR